MLPNSVETAVRSLPTVIKAGRRVNGLFRLMKSPILWEQTYQKIATNKGAMTPGVDGQTFDGFSPEKVRSIIDRLADGSYQPKPVRRVYIPKADGRKRPLGIPTTEDRLVQEVVRILLDQIYEPLFSEHSHGFRGGRSCHTALREIAAVWTGVKWLVDVDVVGFFDNIDHAILIRLLEKRVSDGRFIALIRGMLKAGYVEDWRFHRTISGTPQGGIVSPLLANIYLHELDEFMYRRLRYCRYADDFLIGVIGSKDEARQIMEEVRQFLASNLKLTVSEQKSSLTHASDGARFLGYDVCTRPTCRTPVGVLRAAPGFEGAVCPAHCIHGGD